MNNMVISGDKTLAKLRCSVKGAFSAGQVMSQVVLQLRSMTLTQRPLQAPASCCGRSYAVGGQRDIRGPFPRPL